MYKVRINKKKYFKNSGALWAVDIVNVKFIFPCKGAVYVCSRLMKCTYFLNTVLFAVMLAGCFQCH